MNDHFALTEEQENDITRRMVELATESERRPLTLDEQRLVDLRRYVDVMRNRNANLSAIVQRTIGITTVVSAALTEVDALPEVIDSEVAVTHDWVMDLLQTINDFANSSTSVSLLVHSLWANIRMDGDHAEFASQNLDSDMNPSD